MASAPKPQLPTATDAFPRGALLLALLASLAAFAVVISGQGSLLLQRVENGYADIRAAFFSDRIGAEHNDIAIISVGDNVTATRSTFGQRVDVDRGQLARLIEQLDDAAPRAIGIDIPLGEPSDPAKDQALQRVLREAKARVIVGLRGRGKEQLIERRGWTDRFIAGTGRPVGHISMITDGDRVTRFESRAQTTASVPDSFALLMARALRPEVQRSFGPIAWLQRIEPGGIVSRVINVGAQQPFRIIYGNEIGDTSKPLPARQLAGRLVVVTTGLAEVERHSTPLTLWTGEAMAPVQIQAQAIAQLLDGRTFDDLQPQSTRVALFALACIAGFVGWTRGHGWSVGSIMLALAALIVLDIVVYAFSGASLPMVVAGLLWVLGEVAGRGVRNVLRWEERHGQPWPIAGTSASATVEHQSQPRDGSRPSPLA